MLVKLLGLCVSHDSQFHHCSCGFFVLSAVGRVGAHQSDRQEQASVNKLGLLWLLTALGPLKVPGSPEVLGGTPGAGVGRISGFGGLSGHVW